VSDPPSSPGASPLPSPPSSSLPSSSPPSSSAASSAAAPSSSADSVVRQDPDGLHSSAVFERNVHSVASARDWLSQFLGDHHVSDRVTADAILVLSELVTNALRHGLGQIVARGSIDSRELRVAVTDSGDELPQMLPLDPTRVGGLGLFVVGQVSSDWGVSPFPGGKTVWATLALTAG
jgi:anti-sigma regulatory factor (Ser/Thr protein kinase)